MTQIPESQRRREGSLGFLIQLMARRFDSDMKQRLAELDVDVKVFSNLMLLDEKDGVTQRELGRLLEFPDYFTSRTVDVMVAKGLVERRPDPNSRRSILVYLTKLGRKKAAQMPSVIAEVNSIYEKSLTNVEQKQLISLLHKVAGIDSSG